MKLHEQLVRDHREILESNLTQDEMAAKLAVSRPTIRQALALIGITNSSPVGDFLPLVDKKYPPLTKDGKPTGQRLFVLGASHITSFWKSVQKTEACWISSTRSMKIGGKSFQMGRVSYGIHFGKDSGGLNVARACNNKDCINPDHLVLSSEKNSHRTYSNVTDDSKVIELVGRFDLSLREIANRLGITESYVSKIAREQLGKRRHSKSGQELIYYPDTLGRPSTPVSSEIRIKLFHITDEQYFRYDKDENPLSGDECWMWSGRVNSAKRATLRCFQQDILATRLAYAMEYNIDPGYWDVLHTCDNPRCVNPNHLILGDLKLNAQHRAERGRFVASCGNTKIKPGSDEEKILLDGSIPVTVAAKQLNVCRRTIWRRRKQHQQSRGSFEPLDYS